MSGDYQLQDLITQTSNLVTYRAVRKDGTPFSLTRLRLDREPLQKLDQESVFPQALAELLMLKHPNVATIIDGGQDEVDRFPWVVSEWLDGKPLSEHRITAEDINIIGDQLGTIIENLGDQARALGLDASEITARRDPNGKLQIRCAVDYHQWFLDFSEGKKPGHSTSVEKKVKTLFIDLTAAQLRASVKKNQARTNVRIPMVDEKSPALLISTPPRDGWIGKLFTTLLLLTAIGALTWLTYQGEKNKADNPRKEVPIMGER